MKKIIILFLTILVCISKVNADDLFAPSSKSAILIEQEKYYMKKMQMKD